KRGRRVAAGPPSAGPPGRAGCRKYRRHIALPCRELAACVEINGNRLAQYQSRAFFWYSSNLHQILISVPTALADILMRNENRGSLPNWTMASDSCPGRLSGLILTARQAGNPPRRGFENKRFFCHKTLPMTPGRGHNTARESFPSAPSRQRELSMKNYLGLAVLSLLMLV